MGFVAGSPFGPIELQGLAAAELDCLGCLVLGEWNEIGHVAMTVAGSQFADRDRGLLYDALAGLRLARPRISLTERLTAVPDHLIGPVSVVLRWCDRPGFRPVGETLAAARDALCSAAAPVGR